MEIFIPNKTSLLTSLECYLSDVKKIPHRVTWLYYVPIGWVFPQVNVCPKNVSFVISARPVECMYTFTRRFNSVLLYKASYIMWISIVFVLLLICISESAAILVTKRNKRTIYNKLVVWMLPKHFLISSWINNITAI